MKIDYRKNGSFIGKLYISNGMKGIDYRISLNLWIITSNKLFQIFLQNVHKDMPSKSRKLGVMIFVCSRVITKRVFVPCLILKRPLES